MPQPSFRFVHAADLHLEQPFGGLEEIPDHLRDLLADAPLEAASRVFETAILENVDFVVLAGDVIDPRTAGARAIAFLVEQLEALGEQHIAVYWCGGRVDGPDRWPGDWELPDNVHFFPHGKLKTWTHSKGDRAVARLVGIAGANQNAVDAGEFRVEPSSRFTIAVGYGPADADSLAGHPHIDYWALGGRHEPQTLFRSRQMAHYAGSPQGRCPEEPGPHGCTLVQVGADRKAQSRFVPTDVVRWSRQSISLEEGAERNDLQRALRAHMQKLASEASGRNQLVCWQVRAEGKLAGALGGGLGRELLQWLRREFGHARPAVWSVALRPESADGPSEALYEEDTILGDFLRAVREYEQDPARPLDFDRFLPDLSKRRALAAALATSESDRRETLLAEAALLGTGLLTGEALTAEMGP